MKRLATLVLLISSLLCACNADAPANKYMTALKSSYSITVTGLDGKTKCSATAVGPHTLLTAAHCLSPIPLLEVDGKPYEVVEAVTDAVDHELLYLSGDVFADITKFAKSKPQYGDELFYVGNPDDLIYVLRKGYLAGMKFESIGTAQLPGFLVDVNLFYGDSGSAVLNSNGEIVSVVSRIIGDSTNEMTYKFAEYFAMHFTPEQLAKAATF